MKRIIIGILAIISISSISCSKSGSSSSQPAQEPSIVFTIDASNASVSASNSFNVVVTLTSLMPSSSGIKIEATITDQTTNATISQNAAIISTTAKRLSSLVEKVPELNYWSHFKRVRTALGKRYHIHKNNARL